MFLILRKGFGQLPKRAPVQKMASWRDDPKGLGFRIQDSRVMENEDYYIVLGYYILGLYSARRKIRMETTIWFRV